jgi:hypothetical protein
MIDLCYNAGKSNVYGDKMIQLSIEEPEIEQFFNNSKEEIMNTLKFIAENNLKGFMRDSDEYVLSKAQKDELDSRMESFHNNPSIGKTWDEVKAGLKR